MYHFAEATPPSATTNGLGNELLGSSNFGTPAAEVGIIGLPHVDEKKPSVAVHCLESHYPFVNRSTGAAAVLALTRAGFCLVRIPPLRMAVASNYRLHCIQCCANWLIKHMVVAVFQAAPPFFVLPGFPRSMRNFIRLRPTSRSFFC